MGVRQSAFLEAFKQAFEKKHSRPFQWGGGQVPGNKAHLTNHLAERRPVGRRKSEQLELADLTTTYRGIKIIVEFDSGAVPLSNLLKFWPYIRGELSLKPELPIILCHFSDWESYASWRDLWEWTLSRMREDPDRLTEIQGRQFDHWGIHTSKGGDTTNRDNSIALAIDWIAECAAATPT